MLTSGIREKQRNVECQKRTHIEKRLGATPRKKSLEMGIEPGLSHFAPPKLSHIMYLYMVKIPTHFTNTVRVHSIDSIPE